MLVCVPRRERDCRLYIADLFQEKKVGTTGGRWGVTGKETGVIHTRYLVQYNRVSV